jgi:hypothetical protein
LASAFYHAARNKTTTHQPFLGALSLDFYALLPSPQPEPLQQGNGSAANLQHFNAARSTHRTTN